MERLKSRRMQERKLKANGTPLKVHLSMEIRCDLNNKDQLARTPNTRGALRPDQRVACKSGALKRISIVKHGAAVELEVLIWKNLDIFQLLSLESKSESLETSANLAVERH